MSRLAELSYHVRIRNGDNQEIDLDTIGKIFRKYEIEGIEINDLETYRMAFVHESYVKPTEKALEKELVVTSDDVNNMIKRANRNGGKKIEPVDWDKKGESDKVAWLEDFFEQVDWVEFKDRSYDAPLEFLGDRVLDLIVADYLTERYPDESDQFFTEVKAKLVRSSNL